MLVSFTLFYCHDITFCLVAQCRGTAVPRSIKMVKPVDSPVFSLKLRNSVAIVVAYYTTMK